MTSRLLFDPEARARLHFHNVSEQHLQRYLNDFRYNSGEVQRAIDAAGLAGEVKVAPAE